MSTPHTIGLCQDLTHLFNQLHWLVWFLNESGQASALKMADGLLLVVSAREDHSDLRPNGPDPRRLGGITSRTSASQTALLAANLGGDSVSVASISGAIAGALHPETVNDTNIIAFKKPHSRKNSLRN